MANKTDLAKEAKKLGLTLTGKETAKELEALIAEKKGGAGSQSGSSTPKKGKVYVWVKDRAYINDEQRVESGLYLIDEVPARFSKMGSAVEVLGSEVTSRKLGEIAKWAGVKDDREATDEELLAKLLADFKPF